MTRITFSLQIWLIIISCSLFVGWCSSNDLTPGIRDWMEPFKLAQEIFSPRTLEEPNLLMVVLTKLKIIVGELTQQVPARIGLQAKDAIVLAMALLRLIEVSPEKCSYRTDRYSSDQFHRGNYLQLQEILLTKSTSPALTNIINSYGNIQYFLCAQTLLQNFTQLVDKRRAFHRQFGKFISKWNESFVLPGTKQKEAVQQMSVTSKIYGILGFMNEYFNQSELRGNDWLTFQRIYKRMFHETCVGYLLDPFKTLMMTYDRVGAENVPVLEGKFGPEIRAYYICNELQANAPPEGVLWHAFESGINVGFKYIGPPMQAVMPSGANPASRIELGGPSSARRATQETELGYSGSNTNEPELLRSIALSSHKASASKSGADLGLETNPGEPVSLFPPGAEGLGERAASAGQGAQLGQLNSGNEGPDLSMGMNPDAPASLFPLGAEGLGERAPSAELYQPQSEHHVNLNLKL